MPGSAILIFTECYPGTCVLRCILHLTKASNVFAYLTLEEADHKSKNGFVLDTRPVLMIDYFEDDQEISFLILTQSKHAISTGKEHASNFFAGNAYGGPVPRQGKLTQ